MWMIGYGKRCCLYCLRAVALEVLCAVTTVALELLSVGAVGVAAAATSLARRALALALSLALGALEEDLPYFFI
jgi:hypothetical protein